MNEFWEVVEQLGKSGGSVAYLGEQKRDEIKALAVADKEALRLAGEQVISKKLMEFDSLIIEASVRNLQNAMNAMEPANLGLAKYARSILEEQQKLFMRLTETEEAKKSPINLDFLKDKNIKAKNIKVEIKNTQINTSGKRRGRPPKPDKKPKQDVPGTAEGWAARNGERDQKILDLYNKGRTYREIAKAQQLPLATIGRVVARDEKKKKEQKLSSL